MFRAIPYVSGLIFLISTFAAEAQQPANLWNDLLTQGQRAFATRNYALAEQLLQKALHEAERFAADDWRVGTTEEVLGELYIAEKKFAEADTSLMRALSIVVDGEDPVQVANVNLDLSKLRAEQGRASDAVASARKAVATYQTTLGGTSDQTASALCALGDALRLARNFADAEDPLHQCADIREKDGGIDSLDLADALYSLALTYFEEHKYVQSEPRFKLVEQIRENKLGLTSPLLAQTMEDHAALLKAMGRDKDAERLIVLASAIRRTEKNEKKNVR